MHLEKKEVKKNTINQSILLKHYSIVYNVNTQKIKFGIGEKTMLFQDLCPANIKESIF